MSTAGQASQGVREWHGLWNPVWADFFSECVGLLSDSISSPLRVLSVSSLFYGRPDKAELGKLP